MGKDFPFLGNLFPFLEGIFLPLLPYKTGFAFAEGDNGRSCTAARSHRVRIDPRLRASKKMGMIVSGEEIV